MNNSNPQTVYAHAGAIASQIVGFLVAFIPSLAPSERAIIAIGGVVLSAVILIAHAIRNRPVGQSPVTAAVNEIDSTVLNAAVRKELSAILSDAGKATPTMG